MMERAYELYADYNLFELRFEFVDKMPQTPAEEAVWDEVVEEEDKEDASKAPTTKAPRSQPLGV